MRARTQEEAASWVSDIKEAVRKAEEDYQLSLNLSQTERVRLKVRHVCDHQATQVCTSAILLANFVFSIAQTCV